MRFMFGEDGTGIGTWQLSVAALRVDVDTADNTVTVLWEDKALAMVAIPAMGATGEDADTWTHAAPGLLVAGPFEALLAGFPDGVNFERLHVLPLPTITSTDSVTGATVRLHLDENPPTGSDLAYRTEDERYSLFRAGDGSWQAWDYEDPERPGRGDTLGRLDGEPGTGSRLPGRLLRQSLTPAPAGHHPEASPRRCGPTDRQGEMPVTDTPTRNNTQVMLTCYRSDALMEHLAEQGVDTTELPHQVVLGPYPEFVQLTYTTLRGDPDSDPIGALLDDGLWHLSDQDQPFSDIVISTPVPVEDDEPDFHQVQRDQTGKARDYSDVQWRKGER